MVRRHCDEPQKPLISAIVSFYKGEQFLVEAVRSLIAQTYPHVEIIVVDDASPGVSAQEMLAYRHLTAIKVVRHSQNRGLACARNTGVLEARGEWLIHLDGDDMLAPTYLEATAALLAESGVDAVYTNTQACGISQEVWTNVLALPRALVYGAPSTFLHKRKLNESMGGYSARLKVGADKDFWLRALSAGHTFKFLNEPLYLKRIRLESMSSSYGAGVIGTILDEHRDLYLAHMEDALALAATRYRQKLGQRRRVDRDRHALGLYRQSLLGEAEVPST